ncbi:hypothetical protein LEP1GSC125_1700 [Leptospira mayottensis 200901122]|uniref:Uncharacterized protein n=1 Tax=Leptospira mayottensis 200901122 TaxID=1193010 RepID=A0AA87MLR8_9LEPT|nr:hypothetical protein LEP1GSC125_1700 [Leptospira mayottensis 200901122]
MYRTWTKGKKSGSTFFGIKEIKEPFRANRLQGVFLNLVDQISGKIVVILVQ